MRGGESVEGKSGRGERDATVVEGTKRGCGRRRRSEERQKKKKEKRRGRRTRKLRRARGKGERKRPRDVKGVRRCMKGWKCR